MKKLFFISIAFILLISVHVSLAQTKLIVPIPVNGSNQSEVADPGTYITYIYLFGLSIGGLLGMAIIVYAAIERIVSAGNEAKIKDANDRITQAAIGLVLLFGAYVILQAINPNLTNLTLPTLKKVEVPASQNKSFGDQIKDSLAQIEKDLEAQTKKQLDLIKQEQDAAAKIASATTELEKRKAALAANTALLAKHYNEADGHLKLAGKYYLLLQSAKNAEERKSLNQSIIDGRKRAEEAQSRAEKLVVVVEKEKFEIWKIENNIK